MFHALTRSKHQFQLVYYLAANVPVLDASATGHQQRSQGSMVGACCQQPHRKLPVVREPVA